MRYVNPLVGSMDFVPEAVESEFEFRHGNPTRIFDPRGRLKFEGFPIIEVKSVTFLEDGKVLYRKWMTPSAPGWMDDHFLVATVESVLELIKACGASGPIDELKALLPPKTANGNPSYGPNVLPEESANFEIEPRPNGPNVLSKPGRKASTVASKSASDNARLARAYVEWVEKLPDDELIRIFGRRRPSWCPRLAIDAFKSHDLENVLKLGVNSRADERIRRIIEADAELNARLSSVIARARSLTKE